MVFKSLNDLAPQYLRNLFTKNSACSSRNLRNTETDLRLPKKRSANGQKCFFSVELNYGIVLLFSSDCEHRISMESGIYKWESA